MKITWYRGGAVGLGSPWDFVRNGITKRENKNPPSKGGGKGSTQGGKIKEWEGSMGFDKKKIWGGGRGKKKNRELEDRLPKRGEEEPVGR